MSQNANAQVGGPPVEPKGEPSPTHSTSYVPQPSPGQFAGPAPGQNRASSATSPIYGVAQQRPPPPPTNQSTQPKYGASQNLFGPHPQGQFFNSQASQDMPGPKSASSPQSHPPTTFQQPYMTPPESRIPQGAVMYNQQLPPSQMKYPQNAQAPPIHNVPQRPTPGQLPPPPGARMTMPSGVATQQTVRWNYSEKNS